MDAEIRNLNKKNIYRRLFLFGIAIAGLYFLYRVRIVLLPFVSAVIITYLLNPLVHFFQKKGLPRVWAIVVVYILVFGLLGGIVVYGFPHVVMEVNKLIDAIPILTKEINHLISFFEKRYHSFKLPWAVKVAIAENMDSFQKQLTHVFKQGTFKLVQFFSYLVGIIVSPLFAFYILKDLELIKERFTRTLPRSLRNDIMALFRDFDDIMNAFIRGHLLISAIVGVLTGFGMYMIGTNFGLIIGIIAGVAELAPFIGVILSGIPAVILALLVSKKTAIYAVIVIFVVQQLENAVLSPKIMGENLGFHPLTVIFILLAGGELLGIWGFLFAVPVGAMIKVVLRYIYLKLVDEG